MYKPIFSPRSITKSVATLLASLVSNPMPLFAPSNLPVFGGRKSYSSLPFRRRSWPTSNSTNSGNDRVAKAIAKRERKNAHRLLTWTGARA